MELYGSLLLLLKLFRAESYYQTGESVLERRIGIKLTGFES